MPLRLGSLCSGYGGLDLAVTEVFDAEPVWHADNDPTAAAVLAHHWPHVPNLGDLIQVDFSTVPAIDVLAAGYPCQPYSTAGRQRGAADPRDLWPIVAAAVQALRPPTVVLENVAGHLRLGFDRVMRDLDQLGYDTHWMLLAASDVGAPHQRRRLFALATPRNDAKHCRRTTQRTVRRTPTTVQLRHRPLRPRVCSARDRLPTHGRHTRNHTHRCTTPAHGPAEPAIPSLPTLRTPEAQGKGVGQPVAKRRAGGHAIGLHDILAPTPTPTPASSVPLPTPHASDPAKGGTVREDRRHRRMPTVVHHADWDQAQPALRRWEQVLARRAPAPTEPGIRTPIRLSPAFIEWMMGLPFEYTGMVSAYGARLRLLGNGVVPQQAAAALRLLLACPPSHTTDPDPGTSAEASE